MPLGIAAARMSACESGIPCTSALEQSQSGRVPEKVGLTSERESDQASGAAPSVVLIRPAIITRAWQSRRSGLSRPAARLLAGGAARQAAEGASQDESADSTSPGEEANTEGASVVHTDGVVHTDEGDSSAEPVADAPEHPSDPATDTASESTDRSGTGERVDR